MHVENTLRAVVAMDLVSERKERKKKQQKTKNGVLIIQIEMSLELKYFIIRPSFSFRSFILLCLFDMDINVFMSL